MAAYDDIDDLTFVYDLDELGLEKQHAVKIRSIKQLRPFVHSQPWGIFYLEFEPKRLPVVVLRRILRELVVKRRQTASASTRPLWDKHDLLFISSMGEASHRRISFAHFKDDEGGQPTLQTFDWDDRETQFNGINASLTRLKWPADPGKVESWRAEWSSAFSRPHGIAIGTARELSIALADLAARTRKRVLAIYGVEQKDGPLHSLFQAFKSALVHNLSPESFADMVAQTIAYGLFAARAETGKVLGLSNLAEMIPATNPFLKELFGEIKNTIVKLEGERPVILNGKYETPEQGKAHTTVVFDILPSTGPTRQLKVDLTLQKRNARWTVVLSVYDKDRREDEIIVSNKDN